MKTILAAAALAAAWTGAPASAQSTPTPTRTVAVHDLDLGRPVDIARFDRRLAAAARAVCADTSSSLYGSYAAAKGCERATRRTVAVQRDAAVERARGVALAGR